MRNWDFPDHLGGDQEEYAGILALIFAKMRKLW